MDLKRTMNIDYINIFCLYPQPQLNEESLCKDNIENHWSDAN